MKTLLFATLAIAATAVLFAVPHADPDARANELIRTLHLSVLPKESGYLGIIGVSSQRVTLDGRYLAVQSQNYYMLTRDLPINYLHWLAPDDTHILVESGPSTTSSSIPTVAPRNSPSAWTSPPVNAPSSPSPAAAGKLSASTREPATLLQSSRMERCICIPTKIRTGGWPGPFAE